jgi:hypothetical protein
MSAQSNSRLSQYARRPGRDGYGGQDERARPEACDGHEHARYRHAAALRRGFGRGDHARGPPQRPRRGEPLQGRGSDRIEHRAAGAPRERAEVSDGNPRRAREQGRRQP